MVGTFLPQQFVSSVFSLYTKPTSTDLLKLCLNGIRLLFSSWLISPRLLPTTVYTKTSGGGTYVPQPRTLTPHSSLRLYISFNPSTRLFDTVCRTCFVIAITSRPNGKHTQSRIISAMSRPGPAQPVQGADGSRKPRQCKEAQRLYNQMRDVEEEAKFSEALRQRDRGRQDGPGHSPYLDVPTTHRRNKSRAGSVVSTGLTSSQGSDGGVEDSGPRKRGHRTKPLDEVQRLRTAFVRTHVGACEQCRARKVKVRCPIHQTR